MSETSLKAFAAQSSFRKFAGPQVEAKLEEEAEYQAFAFGRVGRKPEIMLDIIRADGYHLAISYIDIKEIESSKPDNGFTLHTPKRKIIIEGTNLAKCYHYLLQNRIAELKEADRPTAMSAPDDEEIIHSLHIKGLSSRQAQ